MPAAAPFLLLWLCAPVVAYWLSVPVGARVRPLSDAERVLFRRDRAQDLALLRDVRHRGRCAGCRPTTIRSTTTAPRLARRTSPTNIGMGLLSTLAAHDLGYLTTDALLERLDRTLTTLEGLERYRGPLPQLVRHGHAGAAASALRLHASTAAIWQRR